MDNVFLYAQGVLKEIRHKPNIAQIEALFNKVLDYYKNIMKINAIRALINKYNKAYRHDA